VIFTYWNSFSEGQNCVYCLFQLDHVDLLLLIVTSPKIISKNETIRPARTHCFTLDFDSRNPRMVSTDMCSICRNAICPNRTSMPCNHSSAILCSTNHVQAWPPEHLYFQLFDSAVSIETYLTTWYTSSFCNIYLFIYAVLRIHNKCKNCMSVNDYLYLHYFFFLRCERWIERGNRLQNNKHMHKTSYWLFWV